MKRRTPAQVRRTELKTETARDLTRVLLDSEVEQSDIAAATGASKSLVQRWCDGNELATISLADVVLIGERGYPEVARELLRRAGKRLGLVVAEERSAAGAASWFGVLGDISDAWHGWQRQLLRALAPDSDGADDLTSGELDALERQLSILEVEIAEARGLLEVERAKRTGDGAGAPDARGRGTRAH